MYFFPECSATPFSINMDMAINDIYEISIIYIIYMNQNLLDTCNFRTSTYSQVRDRDVNCRNRVRERNR